MRLHGRLAAPSPGPPAAFAEVDVVLAAALGGVGVALGTIWAGAAVAARVHGRPFVASLTDAALAGARLRHHLGDPAAAWPASLRRDLPGPFLYWAAQAVVLSVAAGVLAAAWATWRMLRRDRDRDGLGVERSARFARRRELRRLRVPGPTAGRVILGRVHGRLVATEPRTSVCVVGPSQSGKTSGLCIPALLELGRGGGAVIAASVKGDLWSVTRTRRAAVGEVKVFDPTGTVVGQSATWSPLRAAATVTGAQAAARALVDVGGGRGMENADFWMQAAKELLWPLLYVAAQGEATMRDVVRWVTTYDQPVLDAYGQLVSEGEVARRLRLLAVKASGREDRQRRRRSSKRSSQGKGAVPMFPDFEPEPQEEPPVDPDQELREALDALPPDAELRLAGDALQGIWRADERTRSSIYVTARTVIEAWSDPAVARAADGCEITPEWLLGGDNTLFIAAPARDQARLRPVFACMVADLVHAAFDVATRNGGELTTKLLVLLDEAGNICPVRELPAWCATCPSQGITLVTIWQDRSQQRLRYGREASESIWNNSQARVVLSGLADAASAELTHLLGDEDHQRTGTSVDLGGGRRSVSAHTVTRRLVSEDSLRRQPNGQGLLVYKDLPPMRLALRPWHQDPRLKALATAEGGSARARVCGPVECA